MEITGEVLLLAPTSSSRRYSGAASHADEGGGGNPIDRMGRDYRRMTGELLGLSSGGINGF